MKKAKDFISIKSVSAIIIVIAIFLAGIASFMLLTKTGRTVIGVAECKSQITAQSGDTLSKILSDQGVSGRDINMIAGILKADAGISKLRADSDKIIFSRPSDDAPVSKIVFVQGPWKQIELTCDDGSWALKMIEIPRDTRLIHRTGEIRDGDSFYGAGIRAGIPANVLADVYDLLAFEMDFERDIRAGQHFSVLYEENYSGTEKIDSGKVIAVSFEALRGNVKMYRFKGDNGMVGYYDENGNGAIKSLKRTPINNARVSSNFNLNRKHPILGYTRAHKGVDFRAGTGTPIPSAGPGRVVARGFGKGYGNFIRIRHNGSYETMYGHMSKFASGVVVGTTVRQGQIIGYVGSTGMSTGPHLHYEIIKDGVNVNPMTVKLPAINNLPQGDKTRFIEVRKMLDESLKTMSDDPRLFIQM